MFEYGATMECAPELAIGIGVNGTSMVEGFRQLNLGYHEHMHAVVGVALRLQW